MKKFKLKADNKEAAPEEHGFAIPSGLLRASIKQACAGPCKERTH